MWASLAALAGGHFAVDSCTGIWPIYKTLAHLDLTTAGMIATVSAVVGNGLQVVFGALADRGHRKRLLVAGVCLAGAVMLTPRAESYAMMFALVMTTYVGAAAFHPAGAGSAGSLSQRRTGALMGLFLAGGYAGFGLSQITFASLYSVSPSLPAVLLLLPLAAAVALHRYAPDVSPVAHGSPARRAAAPTRGFWRALLPLFGVQVFATALNLAVIFLLPDLLLSRHAAPWMVRGGGHLAFVLGGCLTLLPAGHAADRFGARRILAMANMATGTLLLALLARSGASFADVGLIAALGAANGANNIVTIAEGNRRLPGRGSVASALLMGAPWCLAAVSPLVAGTLADSSRGGTPARALTWVGLAVPAALFASLWTVSGGPARREAENRPTRDLG
jgi:FSR family fosmidomycin resistance protein-like MFS transporter